MGWMATTANRRRSPIDLWPDARTVIATGVNYAPEDEPLASLGRPSEATLSVYARGDDYHELIKGRLKNLAGWIATRFDCQVKVFVDTAPVLEKPLAQRAGLGWRGKHTNLVSRKFGSWLFLGEIFVDRPFTTDEPETDRCGSCRRCLDICPTDAFDAPYRLDARKCISYLTIEHPGPIPPAFRERMGNRIYGCDDCLAVCPWNKFSAQAREVRLAQRPSLLRLTLKELLSLTDPDFRDLFRKNPIKRIGLARFHRNCLIAAGNSRDADLIGPVEAKLDAAQPIVRGAAVWALARLEPKRFLEIRQARSDAEPDRTVRLEWETAL